MFEDEKSLTEHVVSLRNLLRLTDASLQSVGQKLRWVDLMTWTHSLHQQLLIATTPPLLMQSKPAATCWGHYKELVTCCVFDPSSSSSLGSLFAGFSMYTFYSQSEGHDGRVEFVQKSPDRLTLQDLRTPNVPPSQPGCVCQERPLSGTAERRAVAGSFSPPSSNSRVRDKIMCVSSWVKHIYYIHIYCTLPCLMWLTVIYACVENIHFS